MKTNRAIWIPYADVMAALVLVFTLLIIFFAIHNEEKPIIISLNNQSELTEVELTIDNSDDQSEVIDLDLTTSRPGSQTDILVPVSILVLDLYNELNASVANKYDDWGIRLLDDLTITFENPVVLFEQDSHIIKPEFEDILDEWAPVYFSIVTKNKYRDIIKEVKIEGHTARRSPLHNSYIRTVELSQHRARIILEYIMQTFYFQELSIAEQKRLEYMVSANGFGYGRAIDDDYVPVIVSGQKISHKSRRVIFKIIIHNTGEDVVAQIRGKSN